MERELISHIPGEITSETFCADDVAICHIVNAVGCKNYGLSASIAEKYSYADIYGSRQPLYNLNRARLSSRDQLGRVRIFKKIGQPYIICMVAHFAPGNPTDLDESKTKKETMCTSTDKNYVAGLTHDKLSDRMHNLILCIDDLRKKIPFLPVTSIYIPAGTGCGLFGDTWEHKYMPCLEKLGKFCATQGKYLKIVEKKSKKTTATKPGSHLQEWTPPYVQQHHLPPPVIALDAEPDLEYETFITQQPQQDITSFSPISADQPDIGGLPEISAQETTQVLSYLQSPEPEVLQKIRPLKDPRKRAREEEDGQQKSKKKKSEILRRGSPKN